MKMKKAILIGLFTVAMLVLMLAGSASAIVVNRAPYANGLAYGYASYGSYPVNPSLTGTYYPYMNTPVRVGGFFGQNSAYLIGLKQGYFDGPVQGGYLRQAIASSYYPRVGGYFGYAGGSSYYYGSLRPGSFVYNGAGTNYASPSIVYHGLM
jgi:hypothetical protein